MESSPTSTTPTSTTPTSLRSTSPAPTSMVPSGTPQSTQTAPVAPSPCRNRWRFYGALRVPFRAQEQEQARRPPAPDCKAHRIALGSRCRGCRRPHPLGRRITRQNDGRRQRGRSAERHAGYARGAQARSAPGRFGCAANRCSGALRRSVSSRQRRSGHAGVAPNHQGPRPRKLRALIQARRTERLRCPLLEGGIES